MIRRVNGWHWLAAILTTLPQAGLAAEFWLSPQAALDGSSPQPLTGSATPHVRHNASEGGGSLFLWGKPDAGKTLLSWSLRVVSTNPGVVLLDTSDVSTYNPAIGRTTGVSPKDIHRWEFPNSLLPNEPIGKIDFIDYTDDENAPQGSVLEPVQALTISDNLQKGVGIGPSGAGGLYSDSLNFDGNWLLARIDYTLTGIPGPAEVFLQIGEGGVKYKNQPLGDTEVRFGAASDATLSYPEDRYIKSATLEALIEVGQFEIPPTADFDSDGDVDGGDFLAWQRGLGTQCARRRDGDANRDGAVNGDDLGTWRQQIANQPSPPSADFDGDSDVDGSDFLAWQRGLGKPDAARSDGDANGDHVVDGVDLAFWRQQSPTRHAAEAMTMAVPEPATLITALLAAVAMTVARLRVRCTPKSSFAVRVMKLHPRLARLARLTRIIASIVAGCSSGSIANAANLYWDGISASWDNANNWSISTQNPTPNPSDYPKTGDIAFFNVATRTNDVAISLGGNQRVDGLRFINLGAVTIQGGSTLTIEGQGIIKSPHANGSGPATITSPVHMRNTQTWTNNSAGRLYINGLVTAQDAGRTLTINGTNSIEINGQLNLGNGGLDKGTDPGSEATLILNNTANNYSGNTTIYRGNIRVASAGSLGSGTLVFGQGTSVELAGHFDFAGGRQVYLSGAGTFIMNGWNATLSGAVNGPGSLALVNGGTFTLAGPNGYSGGTAIGSGTLVVNPGSGVGTGQLHFNGGNVRAAGGFTVFQPVVMNSPGTIDTAGQVSHFAGGIAGAGSLTINGGGRLDLTGASSATGETFLNFSTLGASAGNLPSGAIRINGGWLQASSSTNYTQTFVLGASGAAIDSNGHNPTISGNIQGTGGINKVSGATLTLTSENIYTGTTTVTAGTLQIGAGGTTGSINNLSNVVNNSDLVFNRGNDYAYSGGISGPGTVAKMGAGKLTLSGGNVYTGVTTILQGTLEIGAGGSTGYLSDLSNVVNNSALVFNRGNDYAYSGGISGPGTVTKIGAGTLTLAGGNTYSGVTTINAGTLQIGAGGSTGYLSDLSNVVNNAALVFNRSNDYSFGGGISGPGTVTKLGAGTLTMAGANSYTGNTSVIGGTLVLASPTFDGGAGSTTVSTGATLRYGNHHQIKDASTLTVNGGTVDMAIFTDAYGQIDLAGGAVTGGMGSAIGVAAPGVTSSGNSSIATESYVPLAGNQITVTDGTLSMSSAIINGVPGGSSLVKNGAGALKFDGTKVNTFTGGTTVNQGTLVLARSADLPTINANDGGVAVGDVTINAGATVRVESYHQIKDSATVTINGGTLDMTGPYVDAFRLALNGGQVHGTGGIVLRPGGMITSTGESVIGPRLMPQLGSNNYRINVVNGRLTNTSGVEGGEILTKEGDGKLILNGTSWHAGTTIDAGALIVNSMHTGSVTVNAAGTLGGNGTIGGSVSGNGRVAPGNSPGILTINGDYTQTAASVLDIEVNGVATAGVDFDQVRIGGVATLGGTYNFLVEGFTPMAGQEITFLDTFGAGSIALNTRPREAFAPGLATANPGLAFRVIADTANDEVRLRFVDKSDITFIDGANDEANWFVAAGWDENRRPNNEDETFVGGNITGEEQTVVVGPSAVATPLLAEVQQLSVRDDASPITVAVADGYTLSSTVGDVTIGNLGAIELSENATLKTASTQAVQVQRGGALTGDGDVIGSVVVGKVAVGDASRPAAIISPGAADAQLFINGSYTQTAAGQLVIDVNAATTVSAGTIEVAGPAVLAGTLEVRVANDDEIDAGDVITIMNSASLAGPGFADVETIGSDEFVFVPLYRGASAAGASIGGVAAASDAAPPGLDLEAHPKGDMNLDGFLLPDDAGDLALGFLNPQAYRDKHSARYPNLSPKIMGRMNSDRYFDFDDIEWFRNELGLSEEAIAAAFSAARGVPEPDGLALALAAICGFTCRLRRMLWSRRLDRLTRTDDAA